MYYIFQEQTGAVYHQLSELRSANIHLLLSGRSDLKLTAVKMPGAVSTPRLVVAFATNPLRFVECTDQSQELRDDISLFQARALALTKLATLMSMMWHRFSPSDAIAVNLAEASEQPYSYPETMAALATADGAAIEDTLPTYRKTRDALLAPIVALRRSYEAEILNAATVESATVVGNKISDQILKGI